MNVINFRFNLLPLLLPDVISGGLVSVDQKQIRVDLRHVVLPGKIKVDGKSD